VVPASSLPLFLLQAKFITPANFKDVNEERFIAKMCGYPICENKLGKVRCFEEVCMDLLLDNE
jgi:hypothetical protein